MNINGTNAGNCAETVPAETVYFMYSAGRIKIGYTTNILARLSNLRNMAGAQVDLIAAFPATHAIEQSLHRKFKTDRLHGEWFRVSDEIRAFLRSLDEIAEFADFLGTATERPRVRGGRFCGKVSKAFPFPWRSGAGMREDIVSPDHQSRCGAGTVIRI